jgi:hypothetical protein
VVNPEAPKKIWHTCLGQAISVSLQSWLSTLESNIGIVIEEVFVAMLIQRFSARWLSTMWRNLRRSTHELGHCFACISLGFGSFHRVSDTGKHELSDRPLTMGLVSQCITTCHDALVCALVRPGMSKTSSPLECTAHGVFPRCSVEKSQSEHSATARQLSPGVVVATQRMPISLVCRQAPCFVVGTRSKPGTAQSLGTVFYLLDIIWSQANSDTSMSRLIGRGKPYHIPLGGIRLSRTQGLFIIPFPIAFQ